MLPMVYWIVGLSQAGSIKWIASRGGYLRLCLALVMGVSHVEAWFTIASNVEEELWEVRDGQLHASGCRCH